MLKSLLIIFTFISSSVFANECGHDLWAVHGDLLPKIQRYDKMIESLDGTKKSIDALNAFLKAEGLPIQLGTHEQISKEFPNRLEMKTEGPGGPVSVLFLKEFNFKKGSKIYPDNVYEVKSAKSKKHSQKWDIPYESWPVTIEENEIFVNIEFNMICGQQKGLLVSLAIKPDGSYRVTESKPFVEAKTINKCPAAKSVFGATDYSVCHEMKDGKTKQKRILIWQGPMT